MGTTVGAGRGGEFPGGANSDCNEFEVGSDEDLVDGGGGDFEASVGAADVGGGVKRFGSGAGLLAGGGGGGANKLDNGVGDFACGGVKRFGSCADTWGGGGGGCDCGADGAANIFIRSEGAGGAANIPKRREGGPDFEGGVTSWAGSISVTERSGAKGSRLDIP